MLVVLQQVGAVHMMPLQARDTTEVDTERMKGDGKARATRRICIRGGMRSMEAMAVDEVSQ